MLCGYAALALFGLTEAPPAFATGVTASRVGATALSLAATAGLMVLFSVEHPSAGATTLIVSMGVLHRPPDLAFLMLGVLLLNAQGWVINRLAGIPYPLWAAAPRTPTEPGSSPTAP